ncbi:hypothetical protein COLO4_24676 [Corchorus olitorius]|uniref:Uncharacterized protein n=1 Tax=Corchorus olitorius TaxID=93759 RepID=A0A1R3I8C0_9ROSI|nr:hypothetical protein COLO4_24676 [Corchorus olitorius]
MKVELAVFMGRGGPLVSCQVCQAREEEKICKWNGHP